HRLRSATLEGEERGEGGNSPHQRDEDQRAPPAVVRLLDQAEDDAAEAERAEQRTDHVYAAPDVARARGHLDEDQDQRPGDKRDVDREDPSPREPVDDPPSGERPDDRGNRAPGRPRADRPTSLLRSERRDDDRQRRRRDERARDALERAGGDQEADR